MRGLLAGAALSLALAGCWTVRSDLSVPAEETVLATAPVIVSTETMTLPIVAEDTPANRQAALFLARAIEETCGRRPSVLVVPKGQACDKREALFVGGPSEGLGEEGFRVVAKEGAVRFLGRTDYAVYDWCERELGMRFYCEEGTCVETKDEIVVRAVDYVDRPVFERRTFGSEEWMRVAKAGDAHRGGVKVHEPVGWYRDGRLMAAHPEIFETGKSPMLCYGNPATLAYYKERIDRHIAGQGDSGGIVDTKRKVVTVCQWDAPIRCMCPWCRTCYAYGRPEAGFASPVIWGHFLSKLSAWLQVAHPDYTIAFLPYLNTCEVPSSLIPHPSSLLTNCQAEVCTMPGLALLKDASVREREEGILRDWQAATGRKVLDWHYGCWPQERTSAPYVFGRTIRRHYQSMRDVSCGTFVCGGQRDPRLALSMYVWMRCLWNPDIDVEAVYDGFARRMFGPAERPMRELIALQESCWERSWDSTDCTYANVFETSYPPSDVLKMKVLLHEAAVLAKDDAKSARRVAWYASGFRRFFAESDALERRQVPVVRMGVTNAMVRAREVWYPAPWAKTTVVAERTDDGLALTVRCDEPAADRIDFSKIDDDFVWGDDCVSFFFEDGGRVRTAKVFRNGEVRGAPESFSVRVTHDATGWTVVAGMPLSAEALSKGVIRGNVCRWRVGDRRLPKASRVAGSQYEHCRLGTCFTQPDSDPAAFVEFRL